MPKFAERFLDYGMTGSFLVLYVALVGYLGKVAPAFQVVNQVAHTTGHFWVYVTSILQQLTTTQPTVNSALLGATGVLVIFFLGFFLDLCGFVFFHIEVKRFRIIVNRFDDGLDQVFERLPVPIFQDFKFFRLSETNSRLQVSRAVPRLFGVLRSRKRRYVIIRRYFEALTSWWRRHFLTSLDLQSGALRIGSWCQRHIISPLLAWKRYDRLMTAGLSFAATMGTAGSELADHVRVFRVARAFAIALVLGSSLSFYGAIEGKGVDAWILFAFAAWGLIVAMWMVRVTHDRLTITLLLGIWLSANKVCFQNNGNSSAQRLRKLVVAKGNGIQRK